MYGDGMYKRKVVILGFVVIIMFLTGCTDNQNNTGNEDADTDTTEYISFTNGQFTVEYPSGWTVYTEVKTGATITTETYLLAEELGGPGLHIRGHITDEETNDGYIEWYSSAVDTLQNTEDTTILKNELLINEANIEFTQLKSGSVTVYTKYKFIGCVATTYQCTATVENALRSQYQNQIDHIISSFMCTN